uniref:UspA domain-containing protein n=1 Tax=Phenylobacterium glaciei TaxID=2803784 RepID=A0A974S773_9CAUL|nr:hypothetical protein JKL49_20755 [Phenylobacterium glaciei]
MSLQDILLHIDTYPEPTSDAAIDAAVQVAARLGAQITALAMPISIPVKSNIIAERLIGLTGMAREEEARSLAACRHVLDRFKARAEATGVFGACCWSRSSCRTSPSTSPAGRARDLCIVPLASGMDGQEGWPRR